MFKFIAILASLTTAAAFAPAARMTKSNTLLKMNYENEIGAIKPTGYWDPAGLSKNKDREVFDQYRTAELKHGRVCMLGVVGYIIQSIYRFPGDIAPGISFESVPNGLAALEYIPNLGWFQMFFLIGAVDYWGFLILGDTEAVDKSPEQLEKAQNQELTHGRLAMLAMVELLRHDSQQLIGGMYQGEPLMPGLPFL
mmetsp:Transcript_11294/g.30167  ORF Transcript_11294/g.30167 Transcript_11294/m.30167 type:complete len:196 (-) Transcript_11294:136-723(-)